MIAIKFNNMNLGEDIMNEKLKIELEGSDLNWKIENWGVGEEKVQCEFKIYFDTKPEELIQLFKLLGTLRNIKEQTYKKLEDLDNGTPFLTDVWKIGIEFKKFEEDND